MKISVIVDGNSLARWQADALVRLGSSVRLTVYNCTNSRSAKPKLQNAGYYLLRLISLRSEMTKRVPLPASLTIDRRIDFECIYEGSWQKLPADLLEQIRADQPAVIVKFGMGLLRIPPGFDVPILSYHHGDPQSFRGRPAGFYELLEGRSTVGQVVQSLSNKLDAGTVYAFAETKALPHSYRTTMRDAYRCSPLILPIAIRNVLDGKIVAIASNGKNYRLPTNSTVLRFAWHRARSSVRRICYGMFYEKQWKVAQVESNPRHPGEPHSHFPDETEWSVLDTPKGYRFIADPFLEPSGNGLLVEGLHNKTGLGDIIQISGPKVRKLSTGVGHYSYPCSFRFAGRTFVLPEVSEWSSQHVYELVDGDLRDLGEIEVEGTKRLLDPTVFVAGEQLYLFGNAASEGPFVLRLWTANDPHGPFREHPASPVRLSPAGSRMGGAILNLDGKLLRVGQDLRGAYGDGALFYEIGDISPTSYAEEPAGELRFQTVRGPHTVNVGPGKIAFDFYRDRFSWAAGIRRLRARTGFLRRARKQDG